MLCAWERGDGRLTCPECGTSVKDWETGYDGRAFNPKHQCGSATPPKRRGVGQCLTDIIHARYRVRSCDACRETARRMDMLGPDECRANLQDLAEELQSNANARVWTRLLAAAAGLNLAFYEGLILEACEATEAANSQ